MAGHVRPDVRYQFYSRTGILPKYRYDTQLFSCAILQVLDFSVSRLSVSNAAVRYRDGKLIGACVNSGLSFGQVFFDVLERDAWPVHTRVLFSRNTLGSL